MKSERDETQTPARKVNRKKSSLSRDRKLILAALRVWEIKRRVS